MTTNSQVIEDALRLIGVIAEGQTATAEQGANALRKMNGLMEAWAVEEVEIGYFAQNSTTDTFPCPAWSERGVTARLAHALLADYPSAQLSADMLDDERNGVAVIRRIAHYQTRQPLDMTHLGPGDGMRGFQDITTL